MHHKWDYKSPDDIEGVIALLERRIQVHEQWRDFLDSDAPGAVEAINAGVGTIESHTRYANQYRAAISVLEPLVAPTVKPLSNQ